MYSVYLIEREAYFLKEMKDAIPWEQNGFEVVGLSTDRDIAIDEIAVLKPHLVVCGTERAAIHSLMESVRAANVNCRFIVITRYWNPEMMGDFFFAGGYDFLLKPIDVPMVDRSLKKLYGKLSEESLTV